MKQSTIFYILVFFILFSSCEKVQYEEILSKAENIVSQYPDSALSLLQKIPSPRFLEGGERARYGWIKSQVHFNKRQSLIDDSLVVYSLEYYKLRKDTTRLAALYGLVSDYYLANKDYDNTYNTLNEGIEWAKEINDSINIAQLYRKKAGILHNTDLFSEEAKNDLQNSLRYKEEASSYYLLGIWFASPDSAHYFAEKSIGIALQNKDTVNAVHYLRNFAHHFYDLQDYEESIKKLQQALLLSPNDVGTTLSKSYIYLKIRNIDSAQYYLNLTRKNFDSIRSQGYHLTNAAENMIVMLQTIIDYSCNKQFDHSHIIRYNDSLFISLRDQHKILEAKIESKYNLERENMQLIINQQQARLWFMIVILFILVTGGIVFLLIRNRKQKLLEAQENIEALNHLLKEATENPNTENDNRFFKKILLQQLGLIRLIATVPTSANQELLRQMAGISNKDIPADTLLVWDDLYPIIDSVYNNFYTDLVKYYENILIEKEIQLCCLLRADFSTKEIQVVTQQSIPTIYQRKTSIRKKLKIGEKEDIISFLNQRFHP